jgi:hypothetical protein
MQLSSVDTNAEGFVLTGECPHCHAKSAFGSVTKPYVEKASDSHFRMIGALRCIGCNEFILGFLRTSPQRSRDNPWAYEAHYPLGLTDDSVAAEVPPNIASDFQEALRCCGVKSWKATVLMCRRALQTSCDLEGAEGKDLYTQIDDLAQKQRITSPLKEMAHKIRLLGKKGAHGDYSDIDESIIENDAKQAIKFMRHYFEHVYVLKASLES